jgi:hypothetical protein
MISSPNPVPSQNLARSNLSATLFAIVFVALYIAGAWFIYFLWVHFQLVHAQTVDYLVLGGVALGVPFWFGLRRARREQRSIWSILGNWSSAKAYLGSALVAALVGGPALQAANGFLDAHSPTVFATTVMSTCHRGSLMVQGAPALPTPQNSTDLETFLFGDIDCYGAHVGDTIFISVRSGRLGRPWISGRRLQSLGDSALIQRIHARHRALAQQHGQNTPSPPAKPQ